MMQDKYRDNYDFDLDYDEPRSFKEYKTNNQQYQNLQAVNKPDEHLGYSASKSMDKKQQSEPNLENDGDDLQFLTRRIMNQTLWYIIALVPWLVSVILSFSLLFIPPQDTHIWDNMTMAIIWFGAIHLLMVLITTFLIIASVNRMRHYLDRSDLQYIVFFTLGLFGITFICGLIGCMLLRRDLALEKYREQY